MTFAIAFAASSDLLAAPPISASEAVKSYYEALNEGKAEKIRSYYSTEYIAHLNSLAPDLRHSLEKSDTVTRGRSIVRVEVTKEDVQGDKAYVHVTIHYKDGTAQNFSADVVNEENTWKILWE